MLLFFIIGEKRYEGIRLNSAFTSLSSFGFYSGGKMNIQIHSILPEKYTYLYLLTNKTLSSVLSSNSTNTTLLSHYCGTKNDPNLFSFRIKTNSTYNITINKTDILYSFIANCHFSKNSRNPTNLFLSSTYSNPSTKLDSRWNNYKKSKFSSSIVMIILISLWMINWLLHFNIRISFHYVLTLTYVTVLANNVFHYYHLNALETNDSPTSTYIYLLFSFLEISMIVFVISLAGKGWCIVRDSISFCSLLSCLLSSIILGIFVVFIEMTKYLFNIQIIAILCTIIVSIFVIYRLISSINDITMRLMAHMLVISNSGIDPISTPVFQKHRMYNQFQYIICISCILTISVLFLKVFFFNDSFSIMDFIYQMAITCFFTLFGALFRLRDTSNLEYELVDEEVEQVSLSDIKSLSIDSPELHKGNQTWNENTPLPPEPTVIVLQTPEGTQNLEAHVTENPTNIEDQNSL